MNGLKIQLNIFSIIFFAIVDSDQSIIIAENDYESSDINTDGLERVIDYCADRESEYKRLSIVSFDREPSFNFYEKIHEDSRIPVEVSKGLERSNFVDWNSCVLLWLSADEMMNDFLNINLEKFSPKTSNLLLVYSEDKIGTISDEDIWKVGNLLWRKKYFHKLIVAVNGKCILYDPFERTSSTQNSFGALKNLKESLKPLDGRDDFSGYEIDVTIFPYLTAKKIDGVYDGGCAGNAMREISERMNVTLRLYEPPEMFGWVAENGTAAGSLGRIAYHRSDLALNEFFVKNYGPDNVDFSTYVNTDQICTIVPKRGKIPDYLLIIKIFTPLSWGIIFAGNSFLALNYICMRDAISFSRSKFALNNYFSSNDRRTDYRGNLTSAIQRFACSWIFSCFYPSKTEAKWLAQRLHLALGLLFSLVIGGCFTSKLASSFSKPVYLKNIDTLKELDQSGLQILTIYPNLLMDVFIDDESTTMQSLHNKLELKNSSEIWRHVYREKDGAFLEREHSIMLEGGFFAPAELHLVPDCPQKYSLAYPIVRGSPFKRRLNTLIERLNFSGIYFKWFEDMTKSPEPPKSIKPVVIRLQHLFIPFFILFLGLVIATVVFCMEQLGAEGVKPS